MERVLFNIKRPRNGFLFKSNLNSAVWAAVVNRHVPVDGRRGEPNLTWPTLFGRALSCQFVGQRKSGLRGSNFVFSSPLTTCAFPRNIDAWISVATFADPNTPCELALRSFRPFTAANGLCAHKTGSLIPVTDTHLPAVHSDGWPSTPRARFWITNEFIYSRLHTSPPSGHPSRHTALPARRS